MGYEVYISPTDGKSSTSLDAVVNALNAVGLSCTVQSDQFGHWVAFNGYESALNLEIKDGFVRGGGIKFSGKDDPSLLDRVVEVFHGMGWSVGDDEGELE
jgi:hypothetical protein